MEEFEAKPMSQPDLPESTNVQLQIQALRQLILSTLLLVLVVSGAFNIFLLRQYRTVKAELAPMKANAAQIIQQCNTINATANDLAKKFLEYGRTHPDFMPILNKYGIRSAGATGAPPSTSLAPSVPGMTPSTTPTAPIAAPKK